jgi:hypothetical protein
MNYWASRAKPSRDDCLLLSDKLQFVASCRFA